MFDMFRYILRKTIESESPGLADGISYNELMREMEDSK